MKIMKRSAAVLFALMLAAGAACADTLTLNGTVEAGLTVPVYAPIGGTVDEVCVERECMFPQGISCSVTGRKRPTPPETAS